jgi:hypothetical protein
MDWTREVFGWMDGLDTGLLEAMSYVAGSDDCKQSMWVAI